jgi:hypothetical protein
MRRKQVKIGRIFAPFYDPGEAGKNRLIWCCDSPPPRSAVLSIDLRQVAFQSQREAEL